MSPAAPLDNFDAMLKRLHLPTVRRLYPDLTLRAEAEGMSYRDFLEILISEEIAHRAQTRITRSVRKAKFPFLRTIEEELFEGMDELVDIVLTFMEEELGE